MCVWVTIAEDNKIVQVYVLKRCKSSRPRFVLLLDEIAKSGTLSDGQDCELLARAGQVFAEATRLVNIREVDRSYHCLVLFTLE